MREDGEPKAYGAGILSSCGETAAYRSADIRPLDVAAMGTLAYDITRYQPVLFAARSMSHLVDALTRSSPPSTTTPTPALPRRPPA